MGLIAKWHGTVAVPPLPERKLNVGSNWIIQQPFRGAMSRAMVSDSQYAGHDQIELRDLAPPFNILLLRQRNARRIKTDLPVVTAHELTATSDQQHPVTLSWDSYGDLVRWSRLLGQFGG